MSDMGSPDPPDPPPGSATASGHDVIVLSTCSSANKCLLKVAMYSAQMEEYAKALEIYEQVCLFFRKQEVGV